MSPQLELSTFLASIRRRWRWLVALRAGSMASGGVAVALGVLALAFRAWHPAPDALLAIAVVVLLAAAVWAVYTLRPTVAALDDRRIARFIEERRPEFEDGLVTAVEVQHREHPYSGAIVVGAAVCARSVQPSAIVPDRDLTRAAGRGAVACALLLVAGGASFAPLGRAFDAARVRLFPSRISIAVEPGNARVVAGTSLTLRARVAGVPRDFDASPVITMTAGAKATRQPMRRDGDGFVFRIPSVGASFNYGVAAAGVRSREFEVTVLRRPSLQRIDLSYQYPGYTGMPAHDEEDGGDIYAPVGTRVTLRARADKRLTAGTLRLGSRAIALTAGGDPQVRETSFVVERDGSYRIHLTDADGLQSEASSEYFVRVTDDRPPEVRIVRPEGDRQVTSLEEVNIDAQAEDDYNVGSLELVYAVGARPETVVPLSRATGPSVSGNHLLLMEDLKVKAGDVVRAYARAREARKGGRETRSELLLLEVAPFDQQFAFAQSQAGAMGGGGELESLIQAQKNILNGTWNLLRRQAAGRSEADVKALGAAQGELKRRTEAQGGATSARAGGEDPMALAAAAMGRANDALQRARLQDAVPQEMEALTQLGRALAENKRREIAQQQGAGGGGGNRSSQDLSTLFDRELLRQQHTNYENRQSSTTDTRDQESDLQKRIRELARRQDDLAREQRRLAQQQIKEEERRRQLERLTREQEELRRQAEQLARDLQRRAGGSQSQQSESLKDAAGEMRASTGEMRRNNAESASRRGSQAAERLRGAEQSSSVGQGQPQSIGELQMEAQQLSEAQRRIEGQQRTGAAGQGHPHPPASEAERRQLADAQARLAERADRLERAARAMAVGRGDQKQRQAAAQAARELDRQRVAERMREQAQRLQEGSGAPKGQPQQKQGESSLSSTLERVADQLGAGTDADTRRVAGEMARNRAARQELEETARRLERAQRDGNLEAQTEVRRELERARQMLRDLEQSGGRPESGMGRSAPERHEWSQSAPGLESFKQDFSRWEQLKRDVALALERRDLALARQLKGRSTVDPVSAGSVEGLPEAYRARVSKYFEALARAGRRPQP